MSVYVLLEAQVKPESADDFRDAIASIIDETRSYDGCEQMTYTVNQDDPTNVVFVEKWETREKYDAYFAWRVETGALNAIMPMLSAEPSKRFLEIDSM